MTTTLTGRSSHRYCYGSAVLLFALLMTFPVPLLGGGGRKTHDLVQYLDDLEVVLRQVESDFTSLAETDSDLDFETAEGILSTMIKNSERDIKMIQTWAERNSHHPSISAADSLVARFSTTEAVQNYLGPDREELSLVAREVLLWDGVLLIQLTSNLLRSMVDLPMIGEKADRLLISLVSISETVKKKKMQLPSLEVGLGKGCFADRIITDSSDSDQLVPPENCMSSLTIPTVCGEAKRKAVEDCENRCGLLRKLESSEFCEMDTQKSKVILEDYSCKETDAEDLVSAECEMRVDCYCC